MGKVVSRQQVGTGIATFPTATTVEDEGRDSGRFGTRAAPRPASFQQSRGSDGDVEAQNNVHGAQFGTVHCLELLKLLFIAAAIVLPIAAAAGAFDDSLGKGPPTPFPTAFPTVLADVRVCPTIFDSNNESFAVSMCNSAGCSGSIVWCGLDDLQSYRLAISIRGDYNGLSETMTINVDTFSDLVSGNSECGGFKLVFSEIVNPFGGELSMVYQNSIAVDDICFGGLATELEATVTQL